MSPQLSLVYGAAHVAGETWALELEALRAAVSHLGLKEVCDVLDVNRSGLSDAMNERDRKRWAAEWTHVVIAMLVRRNDEIALDLVKQIVGARAAATPYFVEERVDLTAEELVVAYEREFRKMGDAGKAAIARAGRARR